MLGGRRWRVSRSPRTMSRETQAGDDENDYKVTRHDPNRLNRFPPRRADIMADPRIIFRRDDDRYIVFWGDDHIGFVRQDGAVWNAVDTTMAHSFIRRTRSLAGRALLNRFKIQLASGEV